MNDLSSTGGPRAGRRAPPPWHAALAGFCASLVGIGLARFAYTPMLPALVAAHWFTPAIAAYLGAANLAGYLAGALLARPLAARIPTVALLRRMMVLASVALLACAWQAPAAWLCVWRFLSGLAGGALMVLAAPTVLHHVAPPRRGLVGGVIFMGVGAGVVISATLLPWLLGLGIGVAWTGLGLLSLLLTALAWQGWPAAGTPAPAASGAATPGRAILWLQAGYALCAVGWVPHMLFLVDFVARGLGQGIASGAAYWALFGAGASLGPVGAGRLADRIGFGPTLRLGLLLQAAGVVLPAWSQAAPALAASSVLVGAFVTGTVPLVLGRIHELLPGQAAAQGAAWRSATVCFAVCQALAASVFSWIFGRAGDYRLLFMAGAAAIALALAADLQTRVAHRA